MKSQPILFLILTVMTAGTVFGQQINAMGFIHFKPETGAIVKTDQPVVVNGTSAPSNTTNTNCVVQLSVNLAPYGPVKGIGAGGMNDYTKWTATTPPMKAGHNELEGQFQCFHPNGTVSFTKHLVHNVTGSDVVPAKHSKASNNTSTISPPTVG